MGRMFCNATHNSQEMWFSLHWSGVAGILPGSDCGDQPMEAFHSPWQRKLRTLGNNTDSTQVLNCEWTVASALQLVAPHQDPGHLQGLLLAQIGRSTAIDVLEAKIPHLVVDISEYIHVVALGSFPLDTWDTEKGRVGAELLFQGRTSRLHNLRRHRLLCDDEATGDLHTDCTGFSRVLRFFVNTVHVKLRCPQHPRPICTCKWFCRERGCEHVEYVKFWDVQLRAKTNSADVLPVLKRCGRKRGTIPTPRPDKKRKPEV